MELIQVPLHGTAPGERALRANDHRDHADKRAGSSHQNRLVVTSLSVHACSSEAAPRSDPRTIPLPCLPRLLSHKQLSFRNRGSSSCVVGHDGNDSTVLYCTCTQQHRKLKQNEPCTETTEGCKCCTASWSILRSLVRTDECNIFVRISKGASRGRTEYKADVTVRATQQYG